MVNSTTKLKIPARNGETKCHIETDVCPANIPLLLSKASVKRAGKVPDMENDRVVMFNKPVKPDFTSSSHNCVNIMDNKKKNIQWDDQILATAEDGTPKGKKNEHEESQCEDEILTISEKNELSNKTKNLIEAS